MLTTPTLKSFVVRGVAGLILAEVLAWIYLSIFPVPIENSGTEGDSLVRALTILIIFGLVGILLGIFSTFYKRK